MNTTVSYSSDHSWSRRSSTETIYSIQGKETDIVRDTSDTDWSSSDERGVEYEPASEPDDEGPISYDSSGSENEIIRTEVIEVSSTREDGDLVFADSEQTESYTSDSEIDYNDYWNCAQCHAKNNNPVYRYCEKCFQVRKNFFPPRPKRKHKRNSLERESPRPSPEVNPIESETVANLDSNHLAGFSQDSGIESLGTSNAFSQELGPNDPVPISTLVGAKSVTSLCGVESLGTSNGFSQELGPSNPVDISTVDGSKSETSLSQNVILSRRRKRRTESADHKNKRMKEDYSETDSDSSTDAVKPLVKMVSDPSLTVEEVSLVKLSKRAIINSLKENLNGGDNMCIVCFSKPKSGVFVHGRIAHICCCYGCAVKVWAKAKRCPVCNCKVSNVLKAVGL